jgi:serine/threonine protein phosphatase PrpC
VTPDAHVDDDTAAPTVCPHCGEPVDRDDAFCESCGTQLGEADARPTNPEAERGTQLLDPPRAGELSVPTAATPAEERHCTCGGVIDADGFCDTCGMRAASERDHFTEQPAPHVAAVCDRGIHHARNEDAVALATRGERTVIVVCDGVTSATDSDVAALAAARAARDALAAAGDPASTSPAERIEHWNAQMTAAAQAAQEAATSTVAVKVENPPSCTFVAAVVDGALLGVAWIGDSRTYLFTDAGTATQLSVDDSWASAQISQGMSRADAEADARAHAITRWLGYDSPGGDPSFTSTTITEPSWVVVCSDGLWNYCSEADDLRTLLYEKASGAGDHPLATANALVEWANAQGGHDNITAALARCGVATRDTDTVAGADTDTGAASDKE